MRISSARLRRIAGTALLAAGLFAAGFLAGNINAVTTAQSSETDVIGILGETWNLLRTEYIDPVDANAALEGAVRGMLDSLDDPFTGYMSPDDFSAANAELEGEIQGIGVVIRTDEDTGAVEVVSVMDGTPAKAAGVLAGDIFHAIDGRLAADMTQDELAGMVRGPEGTDVSITFVRNDELIDLIITRARITIPNIESRVVGANLAYIRLNQFSVNARAEIDQALSDLKVNQRSGLIFDLRDNPGGLLSSAVQVASAFVPSGPVVTEWFSADRQTVFEADGSYAGITVPIIVLVNEGSASGSELVAAAMQDTGVARIVGERTFGKGTVQTWHELSNGGGLRLTVARWLSPSGRWIHENGVVPNPLILWNPRDYDDPSDPQLNAAIRLLEPVSVTP